MQPGETITPDGKKEPAHKGELHVPHDSKSAEPEKAAKIEKPKKEPEAKAEAQPAEPAPQPAEVEAPWQFSAADQDLGADATLPAKPEIEPVTWSASEFVDHEKNASWFLALTGISILSLAIVYLITRDVVTVVVVGLAAILFGVTAKRKPRTLKYQIDEHGIQIGEKAYPYETFKSFSLIEEGAFNSIQLMPLKRFMPPISLYYPPENEQLIFTTLGNYIPHEERTHDAVERLMRRVRF